MRFLEFQNSNKELESALMNTLNQLRGEADEKDQSSQISFDAVTSISPVLSALIIVSENLYCFFSSHFGKFPKEFFGQFIPMNFIFITIKSYNMYYENQYPSTYPLRPCKYHIVHLNSIGW